MNWDPGYECVVHFVKSSIGGTIHTSIQVLQTFPISWMNCRALGYVYDSVVRAIISYPLTPYTSCIGVLAYISTKSYSEVYYSIQFMRNQNYSVRDGSYLYAKDWVNEWSAYRSQAHNMNMLSVSASDIPCVKATDTYAYNYVKSALVFAESPSAILQLCKIIGIGIEMIWEWCG